MRVILFTEKNSPYGIEFLKIINEHENVSDVTVVTRVDLMPFDYYKNDGEFYDIAIWANKLGVKHLQQDDLEDDRFISYIREVDPDLIIVGNFQKKISAQLCKLAKKGAINFHTSPLPRYAGLAPFFWMAMNNERHGGVSCCRVTDVIDGGDILAQYDVELDGNENSLQIRERHFRKSYELLKQVLRDFFEEKITPLKQAVEGRTYFSEPNDGLLNINWKDSTQKILNVVRAASPYPGAKARINDQEVVSITGADNFLRFNDSAEPGTIRYYQGYPVVATSDGWIRILSISPVEQTFSAGK